jgi:hypothetical protein
MKRSALTALLATVVGLTLVAPAEAKRISGARVCGVSDCREIKNDTLLAALPDSGSPTDPPKHPSGGWYRTTITVEGEDGHEHDTFAVAAFPRARYVRTLESGQPVSWMPMTADAAHAYWKVTSGLAPRPLSSLPGFRPGRGPAVADPAPTGDPFPWAWVAAVVSFGAAGAAFLYTQRRPATR